MGFGEDLNRVQNIIQFIDLTVERLYIRQQQDAAVCDYLSEERRKHEKELEKLQKEIGAPNE